MKQAQRRGFPVICSALHFQTTPMSLHSAPKGSPKEGKIQEDPESTYLIFKLLCALFSNLQDIHHTYIQDNNIMLVNYICSACTANRISDL